ncbi:hypothetical protein ASG73_02165 [Janibacter sp. Soil728]|nr:hypothetical protein ASG73_02165 [Janibacter sp. Soil728]
MPAAGGHPRWAGPDDHLELQEQQLFVLQDDVDKPLAGGVEDVVVLDQCHGHVAPLVTRRSPCDHRPGR